MHDALSLRSAFPAEHSDQDHDADDANNDHGCADARVAVATLRISGSGGSPHERSVLCVKEMSADVRTKILIAPPSGYRISPN